MNCPGGKCDLPTVAATVPVPVEERVSRLMPADYAAAKLLQSVYADTHHAASVVSKAWADGGFSRQSAGEMNRLLTRANCAMTTLESVLAGMKPPQLGEKS